MAINLDRDVIIDVNLDDGKIVKPNNASYYNTDSNIAFFYVKLRKTVDGIVEYIKKEDAHKYTVKMKIVKPKSLNVKSINSIMSDDIIDGDCALYKFTIDNSLMNEVGNPFCYISIVYNEQELVTDGFTYTVKQDPLGEYNAILLNDPDMPLLLKLIETIQNQYENIDDINIRDDKTFSSHKIIQLLERKVDIDQNNFATKTELTENISKKQDKLVSGANIKTINGESILGNGDISVATKTELTENLSSKQNTLVSGTNIKTINGESILGNGNIEITRGSNIDTSNFATKTELTENISKKQDNLVSGTNIKTINGQSLLGNGNIEITGGDNTEGTPAREESTSYVITYNTGFDTTNGTFMDPGGSDTYGANPEYIALDLGYEYKVSGATNTFSWLTIIGYNSNKTFTKVVDSGGDNPNPVTFTADETTAYIRVGIMNDTQVIVTKKIPGTSGGSIDTTNFATKTDLAKKQDKLVSGTSIKTINGESILGSGNISISSGGGSVITPSEGLNGMVSVLTFGADSSGNNDCTSAIQSALDHSNSTGQTIYFPPGRYKVLNTLYVGEYASMKGDNNSITGIGEHNGSGNKNNVVWITYATKVFQGKNKSETELQGCKLCMEGMTLQCEQNHNNSVVFYKLLLNNANIRDCLIRSYGTVILGSMCYVTTITHNWFLDIRNYFFKSKYIDGLIDQKPPAMTDSYITDNYINGSVLSNNHTGFDIHFPNYSVIHNNFIDFWKTGINISSGQGLAVTNNTFQFCMRGIFLETASHISIMNNTFGLMNYSNHKANYINVGTDISSWETTWSGIYISYQCTEINIHCNMGMTVDKLIRINGYGYRNFFIRDNTHGNINNIIDTISMNASTGVDNGGKNVFVQTITSS